MFEQSRRARIDPDGQQVIEITIDGGYHPGEIVARAGLPLRVVFTRDDDDACSERVVFSAPRLDRHLAPTGTTSIDLPAGPSGEVRFTCGMGRYRGRIELVDEVTGSPVARLRDRLGRLTTPLGTALLLWITTLPIVAPIGVITSGVTVATSTPGRRRPPGPSPVQARGDGGLLRAGRPARFRQVCALADRNGRSNRVHARGAQ